jgi:RNA polymerase sigma-B factor
LDRGELEQLAIQYATTRDPGYRDSLINASRELVEHVARTFLSQGEPLEDLVQEGYIGLIKAVDRFDPDRDVKFATYANHLVSGEIRHHLRDRKSLIREPSWLYELNQRISKVVSELSQEQGRLPTISEIAQRTNLAEDSVLEVVKTRNLFRISSIDQPQDDNESSSDIPFDRNKIASLRYEPLKLPVEDKILLQDGMRKLKDIERRILDSIFFGGLSQAETARRLGISDNYVSHLVKVALGKLRRTFVPEERAPRLTRRLPHLPAKPQGLIDPLTGLLSGQAFRNRLEEELARRSRFGTPFAFLLMDVDRLGDYNRRYGLPAGDRALAALASIIKLNLRKVDIVGKGEAGRFFALLPHSGGAAIEVAQRICLCIKQQTAELAPGKNAAPITLAIGVFLQDQTSLNTAEEIQVKALKALLAAKDAGGNQVVCFDDLQSPVRLPSSVKT